MIGRGDTKMSIRLGRGLQVDLRVVPSESFGAALQYFTGSKDHNVVLRGMAKDRGLQDQRVRRVSRREPKRQIGVKDGDARRTKPDFTRRRLAEYIAGRTEEEVYAALDLPWFPPEIREARQEFDWAAAGKLPKLIELADIGGDLHMHTTASDGKASLREMVAAAMQRGLKYIAITDHSQRVSMAHGLDADRLRQQWEEIDQAQPRVRRLHDAQGHRVRHPRKGRHGPARRRAGRGRLGDRQRPLRPAAAARADHRADSRRDREPARRRSSPIRRAG